MNPEDQYQISNFAVTGNPNEVDDGREFDEQVAKAARKVHGKVIKGEPGTNLELEKLILKYPDEPSFRNYLTTWYRMNGEPEKAYKVNRALLEKFPDYVFAKANLAIEYIETGKQEMVESVLGHLLDLGSLFPHRKVFHVGEVITFYQVVIRHLIAIKDFDLAENRVEYLEEIISPFEDLMNKVHQLFDELKIAKIRAGIPAYGIPLPKLQLPLLYELYCNTFRIGEDLVKEILSLPKKELTEDLETILKNSIDNFDAWKKIRRDPRFTEHPMHSLILLAELNNRNSLPAVLNFLRQPEDLIDFWIGDSLTEDIWKFIYRLGSNQFDLLFSFITEDGVNMYSKTVISQAIHVIAHFHPERRFEVIAFYRKLLNELNSNPRFLNSPKEVPVECYLSDMADINAIELKAEMILAHNNYLSQNDTMFGGLNQMLVSLEENNSHRFSVPFVDALSFYKDAVKTWFFYYENHDLEEIENIRNGYLEEDDDESGEDYYFEDENNHIPDIAIQLPGRNDPCFCGSGKKFKKCCLN